MRNPSPTMRAVNARFRAWPVRIALAFLALLVLMAIYAPFLCGEVALIWRDGDGLRFPVFADLFNAWSYPKPHDLLFNLVALELPFLLLGGWLLRNRVGFARRVLIGSAIVVGSLIICIVPWQPSDGEFRSLWRKRAHPVHTYEIATSRPDTVWAVFPLVPHRFDANVPAASLLAPGTMHEPSQRRFWLGTDSAGKDVLAQLIFGARISLTVGLVATGLSMLIGTILGAISGYFGGWVDLAIQRLVELMMTFPTFILILVVVAMLGRDIFIIMTVIGLTSWAGTARLVRGEFLAQSVREYVLAAEALGLTKPRIMFRHILPNALTPLLISATFGIAGAVGAESGLAFIGLGDVTVPSWGVLMEQGRQNIRYAWLIYAPGIAIFCIVVALNTVGNALREALDPRSSG